MSPHYTECGVIGGFQAMRFIMASACKIGYGFSKSARGSLAPSQTASVTALLILSGPCQNVLSVGLGGRAERNACLRRGFIWYFFSCYFRRVIYTGIYTGGGARLRVSYQTLVYTGTHFCPHSACLCFLEYVFLFSYFRLLFSCLVRRRLLFCLFGLS